MERKQYQVLFRVNDGCCTSHHSCHCISAILTYLHPRKQKQSQVHLYSAATSQMHVYSARQCKCKREESAQPVCFENAMQGICGPPCGQMWTI